MVLNSQPNHDAQVGRTRVIESNISNSATDHKLFHLKISAVGNNRLLNITNSKRSICLQLTQQNIHEDDDNHWVTIHREFQKRREGIYP